MIDWVNQIQWLIKEDIDFVLISVLKTRGSSPCNQGNKMLYYHTNQKPQLWASIGGGMIEHQVCQYAHTLLETKQQAPLYSLSYQAYQLHPDSGQCCGGEVTISFELMSRESVQRGIHLQWIDELTIAYHQQQDIFLFSMHIGGVTIKKAYVDHLDQNKSLIQSDLSAALDDANRHLINPIMNTIHAMPENDQSFFFHDAEAQLTGVIEKINYSNIQQVMLFGCGHIARHLVPIISQLPVKIYWVDDRQSEFELYTQNKKHQPLPSNITILCQDFLTVDIPHNAYCLVITYSHQKDYEICKHILSTAYPLYLGLISSVIKEKRFKKFLEVENNVPHLEINKLKCPIGKVYKTQKSPMAIAISIANHLLETLDENATPTT